MDNFRMLDYDYSFMCIENKEFLYENEGILGINGDLVYLKS